jgi:class 3 adenylate cyclase
LLLADFDDDAVQIQDRIDCVQGPRLPFDRLLQHAIIADVTGDAMMAIWISLPVAKQRLEACLAALEMEPAVERFNETSNIGRLPTRIGLHEGDMKLGRLDTGEGSH